MNETQPVRWMVNFWHSDGSYRDELDFPRVAFWHHNRKIAREEAARVLIELREERGDERDWVASGCPDPFEVGAGRHPGGQWILRYSDLRHDEGDTQSAHENRKRTKSAAGAWKGLVDGEQLKRTLYEARGGESVADIDS